MPCLAMSPRPVRVLPRPFPALVSGSGGFGCSCSVVSGVVRFAWRLLRLSALGGLVSASRCPSPLCPCVCNGLKASRPPCIVDPCGSHPVVISGALPSPHSIRPACRLVFSLALLPTPPTFRVPPRLESLTRFLLGFPSVVSFVSRPPSKWGQLSISTVNNISYSIPIYNPFFIIFYHFFLITLKPSKIGALWGVGLRISWGVSSYVYNLGVFLPYYAKMIKGYKSPLFLVPFKFGACGAFCGYSLPFPCPACGLPAVSSSSESLPLLRRCRLLSSLPFYEQYITPLLLFILYSVLQPA